MAFLIHLGQVALISRVRPHFGQSTLAENLN